METLSYTTSKGYVHSNFHRNEYNKWDGFGKDACRKFYQHMGHAVEDHDYVNGEVVYKNADLLVRFVGGGVMLVEAAVKMAKYWNIAKQEGVDVELRKCKYLHEGIENFTVDMHSGRKGAPDMPPDEMFRIPGICLKAGQDDCGQEYLGDFGCETSSNFKMPTHGCCRVRKYVDRGQGKFLDDFIRVPYRYVDHIRVVELGKRYKILQKRKLI